MQSNLTLQYPFILASNSPRRKEILRSAGFEFSVLPSDVDESFDATMKPQEVPVHLAERKANELARISPN
jgi:septum formation protein